MLSIIIVLYNIKARLKQYLENLDAIDMGVAYVIIVVDNAASMVCANCESGPSRAKIDQMQ
jgi:GT2 family glycosyltransferase